jgi:hypothetical protein
MADKDLFIYFLNYHSALWGPLPNFEVNMKEVRLNPFDWYYLVDYLLFIWFSDQFISFFSPIHTYPS